MKGGDARFGLVAAGDQFTHAALQPVFGVGVLGEDQQALAVPFSALLAQTGAEVGADQGLQALYTAIGAVAGRLGDRLHLAQQGPVVVAGFQSGAERNLMLGIGLQQQLLLVAFGALVIAIDRALEQIESLQPHRAPLAAFGGPFLQRGPMHLQGAIEGGDRAEQPLLEVGDHQVFGGPLALAGGGQALVALLAVATEQLGQLQLRGV